MNAADVAVLAGLAGVWFVFVCVTLRAMLRPLDAEILEVKVGR